MKKKSEHGNSHKLTNLPIGLDARVIFVHGTSRVTKRLMQTAVVPGVSARVIKTPPHGDPIELRVRAYSLAMRKSEPYATEVSFQVRRNAKESPPRTKT